MPIEALVKEINLRQSKPKDSDKVRQTKDMKASERHFLSKVRDIETSFRKGLANQDQKETTNALLALDSTIWKAQKDLEDTESISQTREILRESIVLLGAELSSSPRRLREYLAPLVEPMLQLRARFRKQQKWAEADGIRDILLKANIRVEDVEEGFRWRIIDENH